MQMKRCEEPKIDRPSSTRIRTEIDDFTKQPRICGLCKQPGHNRKNCPNIEGPSTQQYWLFLFFC
jgi:hypothetical protein